MKNNKEVLDLISKGVLHDWHCPAVGLHPCNRSLTDLQKVHPILADYLQVGALQEIPWSKDIKFLIPWFVLTKKEPS